MKKKYLLLQFLTLISYELFAQSYMDRKEFRMANSHWFTHGTSVFRRGSMFDMRTNPPIFTTLPAARLNGVFLGEGGSGISDTVTGDLLFYSDGYWFYNRNHQVMPHGKVSDLENAGINLMGRTIGSSSAQPLTIVPINGRPGKYHVFSALERSSLTNAFSKGLIYLQVDMNLEDGLGDVVVGSHKNLYGKLIMESVIAIPGNNCDVWVIVHPTDDSVFLSYHIDQHGVLDTVPVVSPISANIIYSPPGSLNGFAYGIMEPSPLRDKIAVVSLPGTALMFPNSIMITDTLLGGTMMVKFDAETGKISDGVKVEHAMATGGLCFSPDGNLLYSTGIILDTLSLYTTGNWGLVQYDVRNYDQTAIMASKTILAEQTTNNVGLRMYHNLKRWGDTIILEDYSYIPKPNLLGMQNGYDTSSNYFGLTRTDNTLGGVNKWFNSAVYPLPAEHTIHVKDILVCEEGANLNLNATNGYHTYKWSSNIVEQIDSVTVKINQTGTYWVEYTKFCHKGVDTFHVGLHDFSKPIITVNENVLSTTENYEEYQWLLDGKTIEGARSETYAVSVNGNYQVIVTKGACTDTSEVYVVNNANSINEAHVTTVKIYPNPSSQFINVDFLNPVDIQVLGVEGKVYKKVSNTNQIDIQNLAAGVYMLEVHDKNGQLLKVQKVIKSSQD